MPAAKQPLVGSERFIRRGNTTSFDVLAYWRWAHSELNANTERGVLAEFIVGQALGVTAPIRTEWDPYDLVTPEGVKVEVKTSGTWQSWENPKRSVCNYGIRTTRTWDKVTGKYCVEATRPADVYVFCLLHHDEACRVNPLDLDQWTFHVISRSVIENKLGAQKRAVLSTLLRIGAEAVDFSGLKEAVARAARQESAPARLA